MKILAVILFLATLILLWYSFYKLFSPPNIKPKTWNGNLSKPNWPRGGSSSDWGMEDDD